MSVPAIGLVGDGRAEAVGLGARRLGTALARAIGPLLFVGALGYLVLAPLVRLQVRALSGGGEAYGRVADLDHFGETLTTTLFLGVGALVIALVLGTGLAWAAMRLPRRFGWLGVFPILPIVVPPVANVTGWSFLLNPKVGFINQWLRATPLFSGDRGPIDVFSVFWIVVITGLSLTSFVYIFIRAGLRRINYELIEAAQVAGSGQTRAFFGIILPMMRPSFVYSACICLLLALGQFTAPLLLGTRDGVTVLATEVYYTVGRTNDYALGAALASPLLIAGVVVVGLQRVLLSNTERFGTDIGKGGRQQGRTSRWAVVPVALFGLGGVVLPIGALAVVAFSPFWNGAIDISSMSLQNFRILFDFPNATASIWNSIRLAIAAVGVAIPVGYVAAELLFRNSAIPLVRGLLDLVVNLPLGIPAVVFGAGFLLTYTREPFVLYGTPWVVILVYVTLMLPFTTRLQLAARISMGHAYQEASRASGAGRLRTDVAITLPMMRSALSGAAALIFVLLTHEFTASLFVRSSKMQVMGTVLYDIWTNTSYGVVAAMALVMCGITTAGVLLAVWLGGGLQTLDRL